jgi:hypothetical protein
LIGERVIIVVTHGFVVIVVASYEDGVFRLGFVSYDVVIQQRDGAKDWEESLVGRRVKGKRERTRISHKK